MLSLFKKIENDFNGAKNAFDKYINSLDSETDIKQLQETEQQQMEKLTNDLLISNVTSPLTEQEAAALKTAILDAMKKSGNQCFQDGFNAGYIDGSEAAGMECPE